MRNFSIFKIWLKQQVFCKNNLLSKASDNSLTGFRPAQIHFITEVFKTALAVSWLPSLGAGFKFKIAVIML